MEHRPTRQAPPRRQAPRRQAPQKPIFMRPWFIALAVVVIIGVIGALVGGDDQYYPTAYAGDVGGEDVASSSPEPTPEPESEPESSLERDNSSAVLTTLFAGTFTVGQDVPPGRYVVTGDGQGNFQVYDNGMPAVNVILDDGTSFMTIGVPSVTIDLDDGQRIEISGINNVVLTPATTSLSTVLSSGTWVAGLDVPAGTFDAVPTYDDESGNFLVYTGRMFGFPSVNQILAGPDSSSAEFGLGVERVRVNLNEGDTIAIWGLSSVSFNLP